MSSTKTHTRIFAFIGALLFLLTSCALTVAVVWQIHQDNKSASQKDKPADGSSQLNAENSNQSTQGSKLQGSKLADFTPVSKIDSLQSTDTTPGNGQEVKEGDTITAHYTGAVAATGVVFQSSHDTGQPATFSLSGVIEGWQKGVPGMKVGGKRRLLIPAAQAYGPNPPQGSGIPANADLVFDIELVSIGQ
jgi:FKBP-type peptidyl-prolyl cis-trans isomerase